jgi:acyl-CoA synthetase (AMP-forming)/AMP-acid ligase II
MHDEDFIAAMQKDPFRSSLSIGHLLRSSARTYDARIALEDSDSSYSYRELEEVTREVAAGLRATGLGPGDSVVWISPNTADYVVMYLATARAGLTFSPLNFRLRPQELRAAYDLVEPRAVFAHSEYVDVMLEIGAEVDPDRQFVVDRGSSYEGDRWRHWSVLVGSGEATDLVDADDGCPHEIIFTSGTTGQVKGVTRTQRERMLDVVVSVLVNPQPSDAYVLHALPQFHMSGGAGPLRSLLQGGRNLVRRFRPADVADAIRAGVDDLTFVPAQFALLMETGVLDGVDTTAVRSCTVGGNSTAPELLTRMRRQFPNAVLATTYGSTEAGRIAALRDIEFYDRLDAVGRPAPGVELVLLAESGEPAEAGEVGEIAVRSAWLMSGYHRRPDLTSAVVSTDGFYRTGDLGRIDAEGYLRIAGRKKDMIITGGENVFPAEVEDVIRELDLVHDVVIVGVPDPLYEERVVAVVRPSYTHGDHDPLKAAVTEHVRSRLATYKVPRDVYVVSALPTNGVGKVDKVAVHRWLEEQAAC